MSAVSRKLCPGYPPYTCTTLIDPAKPSGLCQFCERTKEIDARVSSEAALIEAQRQARAAEARLAHAQREAFAAAIEPRAEFLDSIVPPRTEQVVRPVFGQPDSWHPVMEIAEVVVKEIVPTCPCGGMADGPDHEKSMLHRQWMITQSDVRHTSRTRTHWPKGANQ